MSRMKADAVLFRSPLTRWLLAAVGMTAGLLLAFGDEAKWRRAPSLHWLAQAQIPLQVWGVLLIAYGVALVFEPTRAVGYAAGCFLFGLFTVSLIATLDLGHDTPKNAVGVAAMIDVTVFHALAIRTALLMRMSP